VTAHMQAAAADYFAYSRHLASWGFAVLQYDFNLLAAGINGLTHTDTAEVRCHLAEGICLHVVLSYTGNPAYSCTADVVRGRGSTDRLRHVHCIVVVYPTGTLCTYPCVYSCTPTCIPQVGFLPHFLDVIRAAASNPGNPLYGKLEFNMGAAGHSRGAKIAAMHFAGTARSHTLDTLKMCQHVVHHTDFSCRAGHNVIHCCAARAVVY
jgi:hypothetical protein